MFFTNSFSALRVRNALISEMHYQKVHIWPFSPKVSYYILTHHATHKPGLLCKQVYEGGRHADGDHQGVSNTQVDEQTVSVAPHAVVLPHHDRDQRVAKKTHDKNGGEENSDRNQDVGGWLRHFSRARRHIGVAHRTSVHEVGDVLVLLVDRGYPGDVIQSNSQECVYHWRERHFEFSLLPGVTVTGWDHMIVVLGLTSWLCGRRACEILFDIKKQFQSPWIT